MPVTTYTTIDGEIVSQDVNGTVHDLLPDPLGHTVGLIGSDQTIEYEFTYWPYEEIGSIEDVATALRYVGTLGYYSDDYGSPRVYVRARHYRGPYGRWLTVDPLWPHEWAFSYVNGRPTTWLDRLGLRPIGLGNTLPQAFGIGNACSLLSGLISGPRLDAVNACIRFVASSNDQHCRPLGTNDSLGNVDTECLTRLCKASSPPRWIIRYNDPEICKVPRTCGFSDGLALFDGFSCTTYVCQGRGPGDFAGDPTLHYETFVLLHEAMHCCGRGDESDRDPPIGPPIHHGHDCNDIIACCILNTTPNFASENFLKCLRRKQK